MFKGQGSLCQNMVLYLNCIIEYKKKAMIWLKNGSISKVYNSKKTKDLLTVLSRLKS